MKEMIYQKERLKEPKILFDEEFGKFRIIGMSLGTYPVAYVGIPEIHILAGFDYFDLLIIDVHGGLTYSERGDGKYLPEGYWWYGWDYAHAGDYMGYYDKNSTGWKYSTEEIYEEARRVAKQFEYLEDFINALITKIGRNFVVKLIGDNNEIKET